MNSQQNSATSQNKVLFFSYWYPNKSNENSAIFIKRHAQSIKSTNSEITVLTLNVIKSKNLFQKNSLIFNDEAGIETHQIYIESRFYKLIYVLLPLHYLILNVYIKRQIQPKFKFNIIHSNVLFPCGIIGYWLSKKYKCKHIISEHWSKLDKFFKLNLYRFFGKKTLDKASAITCVSNILSDIIKKYTYNKNIFIVPNVIDSSQFYFDPTIQKNKVLTFIAVAHWSAPKNPFYFLEALQNLQSKFTEFKLVIIGKGAQIKEIKNKRYSFEIDYKGNLIPNDLRQELNRSHIFLHGSDFETFSVIIAEALMCGLPCIVSPVGISKEVINVNNGFITNNTPDDWENKILACYQINYNNKIISQQLKEKYDVNTIAKLFMNAYD